MATFLALFTNPVTIQLALSLLEAFASSKAASDAQQANFLALAQTLRELGATNAKSRFESAQSQEQQIADQFKAEATKTEVPK